MKAIEVKNLSFQFDSDRKILDDISFDIEKGEFVSIVGHNGSGKSTLAKLLIGLIVPKEGSIFIDGNKLIKENIDTIRDKIALVFQNPDNQFIGSTVEDDIAFGLENHCVSNTEMKGIIEQYANKVGMKEYLNKEPNMLSGGQKQRVAIAGALALNPDILIFDESTSMLDPKGKKEILDLILSIKAKNKNLTIISITHDIEEAFLADKILVLENGKVICYEESKKLIDNNEIFSKYNLDLPFIAKVKLSLKNVGFDVEKAENIGEMVDLICQSK